MSSSETPITDLVGARNIMRTGASTLRRRNSSYVPRPLPRALPLPRTLPHPPRHRLPPPLVSNPFGGGSFAPGELPESAVAENLRAARVYTAAELVDAATISAAIEEITARAVHAFNYKDPKSLPGGPEFIGFAGEESRLICKEELVEFAVADKTAASQIATATILDTPIVPFLYFDLTGNTAPFPDSAVNIEGPSIEDAVASQMAEYRNIRPFRFGELPIELRHKIYRLWGKGGNLALRHCGQAPPLVLALCRDETLGLEVTDLYKKLNYGVTVFNEAAFGKKRLRELIVYENLHLQYSGLVPQETGTPERKSLSLCAHKIQLMNKFRSISMDFGDLRLPDDHTTTTTSSSSSSSSSSSDDHWSDPSNFLLVQTVARASSSGVDRVSIRMAGLALCNPHRRLELMHAANKWLGVPGVLAAVGPADVMEEWLWQKPCGGLLDLGAPGSCKVGVASAPGRMTMAERMTDRRSAGIED
ncbi:hypothetical protein LZ554_001043 [Drepanopeziza brunnea f. sp. 'monogermtubi']|nr:hypothetical protein LZ554_001043 [Drepanopeziza brunnea f. sp. 'monogermtubi']